MPSRVKGSRRTPAANSIGRPSTPRLDRDAIVTAALEILDAEGADELSMRRLAQELGVQGASLYHHVASKQDLRDAVAERLMGAISVELHDDWEPTLVDYATQVHNTLTIHPHAVAFFGMGQVTTAVALRNYSVLTRQFDQCGVDMRLGQQAMFAVEDLAMGAALSAMAKTPQLTAEQAEKYPELAAKYADPEQERVGDGFELGLRMLVAGFRAHLQSGPDSAMT